MLPHLKLPKCHLPAHSCCWNFIGYSVPTLRFVLSWTFSFSAKARSLLSFSVASNSLEKIGNWINWERLCGNCYRIYLHICILYFFSFDIYFRTFAQFYQETRFLLFICSTCNTFDWFHDFSSGWTPAAPIEKFWNGTYDHWWLQDKRSGMVLYIIIHISQWTYLKLSVAS